MKHAINIRWLASPNRDRSHVPRIFKLIWTSYVSSKWRFLCLLNGHIALSLSLSPTHTHTHTYLYWQLSQEWHSYHAIPFLSTQVFLISILTTTPNHIPLKCECCNKEKWGKIKVVYLTSVPICKQGTLELQTLHNITQLLGHDMCKLRYQTSIIILQSRDPLFTGELALKLCTVKFLTHKCNSKAF